MPDDSLALLPGMLDLLVLKALLRGPQHGYAVAAWVAETTKGTLQVEEGALYTALHRQEKRGWIAAEWGLSENNRQAKYYELTRSGRKQLLAEEKSWSRYAHAISLVIHASPAK